MAEEILLTVIVPIYNKEKLLGQCLNSFAEEGFAGRLEVLAIDDGSTDASLSIAIDYGSRYPEIYKVIRKENGGVGSVINTGLEHAKGRYIREVDADDYVHKKEFGELLDFLQDCDSDIVLSPYETVDDAGNHISMQYLTGLEHGREYIVDTVIDKVFISIQSITFKRDLLTRVGFRMEETRYYVDMQMIDEIIYQARTCSIFNEIVNCYRIGQVEQSVSLESYVRNKESYRRQMRLRLEKLAHVKEGTVSVSKANRYKNLACKDVEIFYMILLIDAEESGEECVAFDIMLKNEFPEIYAILGKLSAIRKLRRDYESVHTIKEQSKQAVIRLRELENGNVRIGDVCTAVLNDYGDVAVYRIWKQQKKYQSYFQLTNRWLMLHQEGKTLDGYFIARSIYKIGIYGCGELGKRFFQELKEGRVQVVYGIDQKGENCDLGIPIYTPTDDFCEKVDTVVVTVFPEFVQIAEMLRKKVECSVISLEDVVYGLM